MSNDNDNKEVDDVNGIDDDSDEYPLKDSNRKRKYCQLLELYNNKSFNITHRIPRTKVKKIMKHNNKCQVVSGNTPQVLATACELMIAELTLLAWEYTRKDQRVTIKVEDLQKAIKSSHRYDFLTELASFKDSKNAASIILALDEKTYSS